MDEIREKAIIGTDDKHPVLLDAVRQWLAHQQQQTQAVAHGASVKNYHITQQNLCSDEALDYLRIIIGGAYEPALYEWILLTFEQGQFVRADYARKLVSLTWWYSLIRPLVASIIGRQGFTLLQLADYRNDQTYYSIPFFKRQRWERKHHARVRARYQIFFETPPVDRASWHQQNLAQQAAICDKLAAYLVKIGAIDDPLKDMSDDEVQVRWSIDDARYKHINPVEGIPHLKRTISTVKGAWTEELTEWFWLVLDHFIASSGSFHWMRKQEQFRKALVDLLKYVAFVHRIDDIGIARLPEHTFFTKSQDDDIRTYFKQVICFRRKMRTAIIGHEK